MAKREGIQAGKLYTLSGTIDTSFVYATNGLVVARIRLVEIGSCDPLYTDLLRLTVYFR